MVTITGPVPGVLDSAGGSISKDQAVERGRAGAGEYQRDTGGKHDESEFEAAGEEKASGQVDLQNRNQHFNGEQDGHPTGEQPQDQRGPADQLEQRNEGSEKRGNGDTELREGTLHPGESEDKDFLRPVGHKIGADYDAQYRRPQS